MRIERDDDPDSQQDSGSVWTSYSDLFMGVAIIFLVMFVLATLKASISQSKAAKDRLDIKEYASGLVSEETKAKSKRNLEEVNKSLEDIADKKQELDKALKNINNIYSDLDIRSDAIKRLKNDQQEKAEMLALAGKEIAARKAKIAQLEASLLEAQNRKKEQLEEIAGLKTTLNETVKNLNEEKVRNDQLKEKEKESISVIDKLKTTLTDTEDKLTKKEKEAQSLEASRMMQLLENQKLADKNNELDQIKKSQEAQIAEAEKVIEQNNQQIAALDANLKKTTTERTELNKALNAAKEREKTLKDKVAENTKELAKTVENNQNLTKQNMDLNSKLSAAKLEISGANTQISGLKNQSDRLNKELNSANNQNEKMKSQNKGLIAQVEGLKSSLEKAESDIDGLEGQINGLKSDLGKAQGETKGLKSQLGKAQGEIAGLKGDLGKAQGEAKDLKSQLGKAQGEIAGLKGQLGKSQGEVEGLKGELGKAKGDLGKAQGEIAGLKGQLGKAEGEAEGLKGELGKARGEIAGLKGQLEKGSGGSEGLQGELGKAKGDLGKAQGEIAALKDQLGKAQGANKELEYALKAKDADLARKQAAIAELDNKNDIIQAKLNSFGSEQKNLPKDCPVPQVASIATAPKPIANGPGYRLMTVEEAPKVTGEQRDMLQEIIDKMNKGGAKVGANKETGALVLEVDDSFYFDHGSARLSDTAKHKLQKVVPVFIKEVLAKPELRASIKGISIEGHTSPVFHKTFVNPQERGTLAFNFNLRLSKARAAAVLAYITGGELSQDKELEKQLKALPAKVFSMSYTKPIQADERTQDADKCERYDCARSRRVEIGLILRRE